MKTNIIIAIGIVALLTTVAFLSKQNIEPQSPEIKSSIESEQEITNLINGFGAVLKNVSLAADPSIASAAIEEEYSPFITSDLLEHWKTDPWKAPGRLTSSPWPENIVVSSIDRNEENGSYLVSAEIVLMTSNEVVHGGEAGRTPIVLTVVGTNGQWSIADYHELVE